MGTFIGHVIPGTFFLVISIWWIVNIFNSYFTRRKTRNKFQSSTYFPFGCCGPKSKTFPTEPVIRLTFVAIGMAVEIIGAFFDEDVKFIYHKTQHSTMYFFFGLASAVDLFHHLKWPIPDGLNYISYVIAFFVEGTLFKFHLHGRGSLNVTVHILLVYIIAGCAVTTITEMVFRNNVLVALSRTYFVFLQGTWFWQIAFILYNPLPGAEGWDEENHDQIMLGVAIFTWHFGAVFILMFLIGTIVYKYNNKIHGSCSNNIQMTMPLISTDFENSVAIIQDSDHDDKE